jgi:hypothetical protein
VCNDPMKIIYGDIIQSWIGDFFEVDAVLASLHLSSTAALDRTDEGATSCCAAPWFNQHRRAQFTHHNSQNTPFVGEHISFICNHQYTSDLILTRDTIRQ